MAPTPPSALDLRRPHVQGPPPDSTSELLIIDQWADDDLEAEPGVDFRVRGFRRSVIRYPSVESRPEAPVINQRADPVADVDSEEEAVVVFREPDLVRPVIQLPQPRPMPELPSLEDWTKDFDILMDDVLEEDVDVEPRVPVIRRPIVIRIPSAESMPELPSLVDWDDAWDRQFGWFTIGETEPVHPLVSPVVGEPYQDGNIMRFPWFDDVPDKRFFAMVGIAHWSWQDGRYTHVSHWGANQGCPIREGQQITIALNLEARWPSLSIFIRRDNGTTVECRVYGSECVSFSVDGPGSVNDWWFEPGSEQHLQQSIDTLLQFSWQLKAGATLAWGGITEAEINDMSSEWLNAHPSDAMIVELTRDFCFTMSATITLPEVDPQLFAEYFQAMMNTASRYGTFPGTSTNG